MVDKGRNSTMFSGYAQLGKSNYIFICEMWLFDFFFLSANLIYQGTGILKYLREFLGL